MKVKNIKQRSLIGIIFLLLLLTMTSTGISVIDSVLGHMDELMELVLLLYILLNIKSRIAKKIYPVCCIWLVMLAVGLCGSLLWREQSMAAIIVDVVFTCSKFMVAYAAGYRYFSKRDRDVSAVYRIARILVVALTILSVHDLIFPAFFDKADFRYFLYSQRLFFIHPTYLTHAAVTLLLIFVYEQMDRKVNNMSYMVMSSYLIVVAMRTKGIGFLGVFWLMYAYLFLFKFKEKGAMYLGGGLVAVIFGMSAIKDYFFTAGRYSPRQILLQDSWMLFKRYFPIGAGFAAFGSPTAANYYSPLYTELGYENNWGMGPVENMFLSDSFWPCILGQFGFFGLVLMCCVIFVFMKKAVKMLKRDKREGFVPFMIMLYLLISSFAETSFFNPTSMLLFLIFAYIEVNAAKRERFRPI